MKKLGIIVPYRNRPQHLEEFKLTTSYFENKEINHLISCKFSQLEEIEKLIKKENGF